MELLFATNNQHKLREIHNIITRKIRLLCLSDIGFEGDIPETHETLEENAAEKAEFLYNRYGMNCFADDTGLEIDALQGEPGVYSSRYAGENVTYDENMNKVLAKLTGITNRKARFRTVICLIINKKKYFFRGEISGLILEKKRGSSGFGYDPIFQPEGFDQSFAELSLEEKNRISHRGKAAQQLVEFLNKYSGN